MRPQLFRKRYEGVHLVFFLCIVGVVAMVIQSYRNVTALGQQVQGAIVPILTKTSDVDAVLYQDAALARQVLRDEVQILRSFVDSMQQILHDEVELLLAFNTLTTVPMLLMFFIGIEAFRRDRHLKNQQALAEEENRLKSRFLSLITHELKTPMTSILALSKLLSRSELNPHQQRDIECIQSAGQGQLNLIHSILDHSKLQAGHMSMDPKPFPLDRLLERLEKLTIPLLRGPNINFKIVSQIQGTIESDEGHLESALRNLLSNACRHTLEGNINLTCRQHPDVPHCLLFEVEDTGEGIPEDKLPLLGQPFYQAHGRAEGTGLGLSIVDGLVKLVGGNWNLESQVGKGTKISMSWPISAKEEPQS